jgi:Caspase domain
VKPTLGWPVVVLTFFALNNVARAETEITSVLDCSALTKNPEKSPRFSTAVSFKLSGNTLKAERIIYKRPGKESYAGTIGPDNIIKISGRGAFFDRKDASWRTEFSGSINTSALTSIKGVLTADLGGHRDCTLTFMLPPDKFAVLVAPSGAIAAQADHAKSQTDTDKLRTAVPAATPPQNAADGSRVPPTFGERAIFGKRVALVIGNSGYQNVPALQNPQRDAATVAKALEAVGFQSVTLQVNLGREQLVDTLRTFAKEAENADWAVVYYAGHGIEVAGINYLIPTDAKIASDRDISLEAIPIDQVLNAAERARALRLVILDACRDNPFANQMKRTVASRSIGRGLAKIEPDPGTLVVYAAKHGETALDGDGGNSPFVTAFVKDIQVPGVEVRRLFDNVRDDVMDMTGRRQQPYSYGSVPGRQDFYFTLK